MSFSKHKQYGRHRERQIRTHENVYFHKMELLPNEVLERILLYVVITEVKDLKLVKQVWKEKADRSIHRLSTVCTRWSHILQGDFFSSEIDRILDGTAPDTIRLEVLQRTVIRSSVHMMATLRNKMYLLNYSAPGQDVTITVYNRNNMVAVADVALPLSGESLTGRYNRCTYWYKRYPVDMSGCPVSDCVYVLDDYIDTYTIVRIAKDNGLNFNVLPLVMNLSLRACSMCVSGRGDLMILSIEEEQNIGTVHVYAANGILQQKILSPTIPELSRIWWLSLCNGLIEVRSGNLVVFTPSDDFKKQVYEFDVNGRMVNQYTSSATAWSSAAVADSYGRLFISDTPDTMVLLDAEMNVANFIRHAGAVLDNFSFLNYCSERNELIGVYNSGQSYHSHITVFRFREI